MLVLLKVKAKDQDSYLWHLFCVGCILLLDRYLIVEYGLKKREREMDINQVDQVPNLNSDLMTANSFG